MGLLDLPSPALYWVDAQLSAVLPPLVRITFWAVAGAVVSMELYRLLSPQVRIRATNREQSEIREELRGYDGELADAKPRIKRLLKLSFLQIGLVAPPAIIASLPLLAVIIWLDTAYARAFPPPGEIPRVTVPESGYDGRWVQGPSSSRVVIADADGGTVADIDMQAPVPVVHKRRWWNLLIANPAGYLPEESPVERVEIALPRKTLISAGPSWLGRWEIAFFTILVVASLTIKRARKVA